MSLKATPVVHSLRLQLRIVEPPADVRWAAQLGRSDLLPPVTRGENWLEFEIPLELVSTPDGESKVRGAAMQGPRGGRFLYLASGSRAGDIRSRWDRRAKISLETLPLDAIRARPADVVVVLTAAISGTAKDGGPACGSVPLLEKAWRLDSSAG